MLASGKAIIVGINQQQAQPNLPACQAVSSGPGLKGELSVWFGGWCCNLGTTVSQRRNLLLVSRLLFRLAGASGQESSWLNSNQRIPNLSGLHLHLPQELNFVVVKSDHLQAAAAQFHAAYLNHKFYRILAKRLATSEPLLHFPNHYQHFHNFFSFLLKPKWPCRSPAVRKLLQGIS